MVWDRVLGSLKTSPEEAVSEVGLAEPNHNPHDLVSVLFAPFIDAFRTLNWTRAAAPAAVVFLAFTGAAHAEESDDDGSDGTMIITAESGTTRVAGAATSSMKTLEQLSTQTSTRSSPPSRVCTSATKMALDCVRTSV